MRKSCSKSLQNRELAREQLTYCVFRYRLLGYGTVSLALDTIAPYLGITRRKAHTLFYDQTVTAMSAAERHSIRMGVARALHNLASRLRAWAEILDQEANTAEQQETQLTFEEQGWFGNNSSQKSAIKRGGSV